MTFRRLGSRLAGSGIFLRLERLHLLAPDGTAVARDVLRHPGGVAVLPVEGERLWFVRQYRVAVGAELLEIPAGKLDRGDLSVEEAARRELAEELGATAGRLERITSMHPSPGYTDEVIHIFLAEDVTLGERAPEGIEEHHAELVSLTTEEALRSIGTGEITDAKTLIALLAWAQRRTTT